MAFLGACESIGYYAHVTGGQLKLLADRQPVGSVLEGLEDGSELKERLLLSQRLLDFAESELALEVGGRYRSYVDVNREAVVWNLFAAPELSLDAHTWCYPFVGCAPYRGYFSRDRAEKYRARLESSGLETYVGRVSAYSTLGWFDDPLLSTFMDMSETEFVELLFHELAHSRVWVRNDATFNESYASFVGREGLKYWLEAEGRPTAFDAHREEARGWLAARRLLETTREQLAKIYDSPVEDAEKRRLKRVVIEAVAGCLETRADDTGLDGYRRLVPRLNNAYLASLATYSDLLWVFEGIFEDVGRDWPRFHARVEELARQSPDSRARSIEASGQDQVTTHRDDDGTEEIQCEALSGHGLDRELAGAEHDDIGGRRHR